MKTMIIALAGAALVAPAAASAQYVYGQGNVQTQGYTYYGGDRDHRYGRDGRRGDDRYYCQAIGCRNPGYHPPRYNPPRHNPPQQNPTYYNCGYYGCSYGGGYSYGYGSGGYGYGSGGYGYGNAGAPYHPDYGYNSANRYGYNHGYGYNQQYRGGGRTGYGYDYPYDYGDRYPGGYGYGRSGVSVGTSTYVGGNTRVYGGVTYGGGYQGGYYGY